MQRGAIWVSLDSTIQARNCNATTPLACGFGGRRPRCPPRHRAMSHHGLHASPNSAAQPLNLDKFPWTLRFPFPIVGSSYIHDYLEGHFLASRSTRHLLIIRHLIVTIPRHLLSHRLNTRNPHNSFDLALPSIDIILDETPQPFAVCLPAPQPTWPAVGDPPPIATFQRTPSFKIFPTHRNAFLRRQESCTAQARLVG